MKNWIDKRGGLSIIKTNENKIPMGKWKEHSIKQNTISDWYDHYKNGGSVGIVCGSVSGNLEVIDIDTKNDPTKEIATKYGSLIPEEIRKKILMSKTPSGGFHFIYRCPDGVIEKSLKLAIHTDGAVIIETRGESSYINHNKNYKFVKGGSINLMDLKVDIPEITPEERETLLTLARSLNRQKQQPQGFIDGEWTGYKNEAINKFNKEFNLIPVLIENGWKQVDDDGDKIMLLRPGQTSSIFSAYYYKDNKTLYVHSSSTQFLTDKPYNNFQSIQTLFFNKDENSYSKSLTKLKEYGYEEEKKDFPNILDEILLFLKENNVRLNVFDNKVYINNEPLRDAHINTLYIDFYRINPKGTKNKITDCVYSGKIEKYNPIDDYINKNFWRKTTGNFEKLFNAYELPEHINKDYVVHFLKKWYIGMIAQAMGTQIPNELYVALTSTKHGTGKTTFASKNILPSYFKKYQDENKKMSDDKDYKVLLSEKMLIIDNEMSGNITKKDIDIFKSITTNNIITIRKPYERTSYDAYRRASFIGTSNSTEIIHEKQNRRIIPIEIIGFNEDRVKELNEDELFMEAYNLYKKGDLKHYLQNEEERLMLIELSKHYMILTDTDTIIDEYINQPEGIQDTRFISVYKIKKILMNEHIGDSKSLNSHFIGRKLTNDGYEKTSRTEDGKQKRGYLISKKSRIFEYVDFPEMNINTILNKQTNLN